MEDIATWEKIVLGLLAVVLIVWFGPGIKASLENTRKATSTDWKNVLIPIGLVVLFVIFLLWTI